MAASTLAAAQDPAPAANPAAAGPSFSISDQIPSSAGYGDAYSLDEIRLGGAALTEAQQVERWQAELGAGRARAGAMLGAYLSYRALTETDCAAARDAFVKADELGNDQAAWQLAKLARNDTCGVIVDRASRERWLKKAAGARQPRRGARADEPVRRLDRPRRAGAALRVRARRRRLLGVGQGGKPLEGFDATALQEMEKNCPPPTAAARKPRPRRSSSRC